MQHPVSRPAMQPAAPSTIDREALATDTAHVLEYLRTLEAALPGAVSDELLSLLESAANPLTLELLAGALERLPPRR